MIDASDVSRLCGSYWLRVSAVSLAAALVVTSLFVMFGSASVLVTLQHALIHSGSMGGLAGWTLPRVSRRLHGVSVALRWGVLIPLLLGLAVAGTGLACGVLTLLAVNPHREFWACFTSDLWINALLTGTIGIGMILYEVQRARLAAVTLELRTKELEHERASKMALEARLSSLESRLHPHFLFNTLNAISALIRGFGGTVG